MAATKKRLGRPPKRVAFDGDTGEMIEEPIEDIEEEEEGEEERVDNREPICLFPTAHIQQRRHMAYIKVRKEEPPGQGFKGRIGVDKDEVYLAKRWGNGSYKLQGCNSKGRVLRETVVEVSVSDEELPEQPRSDMQVVNSGIDADFAKKTFENQQRYHEAEVDRYQKLSSSVTDQVKSQGEKYLDMVTSMTVHQNTRDREFFQSQKTQQETFLTSMIQQQQMTSAQQMQMAQENFKQTLLMQQSMAQQAAANNNPALMISMLMKGLEMGKGMESDESDWVKAVSSGVDGLKSLALLKMNAPPPQQLPIGMQPKRKALPNPAPTNGATGTAPVEEDDFVLDDDELEVTEAFKEMCNRKGVDYKGLLAQAWEQVETLPDQQPEVPEAPEDEPESTEDSENDVESEGDPQQPATTA